MIAVAPRTHETDRGHVIDMQRARLLAATGQVACESGLPNVTVAHIVERAGVSRRTFYEIFTDTEHCLLSALQAAFERAQERVLRAWRSPGSWSERVRGSLVELLCLFDEEPALARLLVVESLAAGQSVLEQRARALSSIVDAIEHDAERRSESAPSRVGAEGAVGGVLAVLHARISQHAPEPLVDLASSLTSMLVLPYRGTAAARRELARPVPVSQTTTEEESVELRWDPFKASGMRLTYRTMRVLSAIAEHPRSSNRQVGELAEMGDQGQVSKLLSRLERVQLIANERDRQSRGEPNVWVLTPAGRRVTSEISAHMEHTKTSLSDRPWSDVPKTMTGGRTQ